MSSHVNKSSSCILTLVAVTVLVTELMNTVLCFEVKLKCTHSDEYYHTKPGTRCTSYYKCIHGRAESKECGAGSMFDFYKQTCTRASSVCYEPICTGRTNGIYQDTTHACRRSFTCHNGRVLSIDNCPSSQLHNGQRCVSQDLVMCESPEATAIGYPFSGDNRCIGKPNDSFGFGDCSTYIVCRNQQVADIMTCPNGYRFKNNLRKCVSANLVPTCPAFTISNEALCKGKSDGASFDPASTDCKTYVICRNQKFISREKCGDEALFNGDYCVPEPFFTCPLKLNSPENDVCHGKMNGFHPNPRFGCSSYVRCMSQKTVESYNCPNGQYFDPEERNCVFEKFSERRKCLDRSKSSSCEDMPQGFYQDFSLESNCNKYYFCVNGFKTDYRCSSGKIFNGQSCVDKSMYVCPTEESNSCASKEDGYYKDLDGGCRSYYYCANGHKVTYLCEEGFFFDGNKCSRPSHKQKCNVDSICSGKSDGYHPDVKTNCRSYVFCLNQEKVTKITCRGNKIFDGDKCVLPNTHACENDIHHNQYNCVQKTCGDVCKKDGFFPDIDSRCRSYYFCIGGRRSEISCPGGKIFNGELCVAEDQFQCPEYCEE